MTNATHATTAEGLVSRIDDYLHEAGYAARASKVVPLTGDASDRRYFRVLFTDGGTMVLALHAGPIEFERMSFASVHALLELVPLPVPRVIGHSDALGIIALQDLGDVTLQAHLGAASTLEHDALYRQAVGLIEVLQRRGAELSSDRYAPYHVAFDVEKLTWELDFFVRHFLEGYRGRTLSATDREALREEWSAIAHELAAEPRVLCHRDYHSRNLMLHGGRLYLIDFQDARMGPDTYDLVSLLRDSYVDISERQVDDLLTYFLALRGLRDPDELRRRFDVMALQRNLKALGTFGYQTTSRGNTVYIQYIPRTIRYAGLNLTKYSRWSRLCEILAAHIDELRQGAR